MPDSDALQRGAASASADVAHLLDDLRLRFAGQLAQRLLGVRTQLQQLVQAGPAAVDLGALHREVHGLTGAAGTFGLPEVSRTARVLENRLAALLRGETEWTRPAGQALVAALADLEQAAALPGESPPAGPLDLPAPARADATGTDVPDAVPVYFCQGAERPANDWTEALEAAGYRVQNVSDLPALCGAWAERPLKGPAVLLLDLARKPDVEPALEQVRRLGPSAGSMVVLAALPDDDLALRLQSSRAGVQRTFSRTLAPARLVEWVDMLTGRRPRNPYRVLLVDDDPLLLQAQAAVLRGAGMRVRAIDQPLATLQVLEQFRPDVLVLDVYMPAASGPELATALREREAWLDLPVLFLSAETDLTQQLLALNLGGDDFLVKPVQPAHLVAAVTARARRARQNTALRRRLQTSLYEREREHLALDHHAIVSVADPRGRITYANDLFCRISGYTREQVTGLNHAALRTDVQPADFFDAIGAALTAGRVWQGEVCCRRQDGNHYWAETTITPFLNEKGRLYQYVVIQTDISHIKAAEAALSAFNQELEQRVEAQTRSVLQSERLAQATLDALSARVVILDGQGDIVAANRSWRAFGGGRSPEQIRNYLRYLENGGTGGDPRARQSLLLMAEGIRRVMSGAAPNLVQEYSLTVHGDPHWFISRVERLSGSEDTRIVVSHEDITPMKLAERAQLRSQRLESLGTLAGGVAHDLNNALAPVLMGMTLLKEQYPEESRLFDMIQASAQRGADMVRQLLTFARGVEGERVPVQPLPLLRELERLMKGSFPKNIVLQVHCDEGLPPVLGDATQLHQVLLNLCVNARDAMPAGGRLALKAQAVEFDEAYARSIADARPGRYVALRVSDTGSGIPPEIQDRIFDPFFTTKSSDKGTGLGLSTVLGIVRSHGGFIQVYSQPGQGAQFTVYLPEAPGADADTRRAPANAATGFRGRGETVLFVDDEAAVREVGRTVLERLSLTPVLATDGADGLVQAAAHRGQLRVVITDLHMPHMDGLTFVRALRRTQPDMPVILASGRVDEGVAAELQALGVTQRLDKPFTQEQLARALQVALGA